jgi:hypothetical protein
MSARLKPAPDPLEAFAPVVDMELDAGIRRAVLVLCANGVETFESCEGGEGHAFPDPTVRFWGGTWAGYKAFAIAMEHGLPVLHLRYCFTAVNGHLETPCWELVFRPEVRAL